MEKELWLEAWKEKRIGFHQSAYNKTMVEHFENIDLKGKTVLIPLAGKSLDIIYFLERGATVIANELSPIAAKEFFEENKINFQIEKNTHHEIYRAGDLHYYLGDFFEMTKHEIGHIDFLYDRACIVALPSDLRVKYFEKINLLITRDTHLLILTYKHDGPKEFGPPFYVPENEIKEAYSKMGHSLSLNEGQVTKADGRFEEAGMKKLIQLKWHSNI
ncbi:thiopurine S-methyltransferase Se/Te detoxification family [Bacteriovorax sp. Seq25_V]|uniref:thiopurine S-methyltransferase Se/Te detoxification family n=1 Tax=Bacteriovorax sp. Seq25_V TaxID=1201288 RepID=UPI000389FF23|nr:thiopurine S-methyltransferase Se/Te detoxification family [Bacteriovorax sp. Seq25_V]EQC47714.1 thiopurine S-methyltransferase, Se/Te detoxification family [Bacteriovorax sp. Seq25_V]